MLQSFPNPTAQILFILTDDLDAKLGTLQYMPHLQQLMVSQGLMFNDFLIDTPLCCPSRSSFLRGQYLHNHQSCTPTVPCMAGSVSSINSSMKPPHWRPGCNKLDIVPRYMENI